ncbi:MAG TPA: AcvB/VirJ family lysyl-phosphatidylglycerol hydrolase, partial [Cyclobacteriaceae bacterium]|nr:AcvB/VirJ family lysyl-phosphatidylglycerol hydrolase [Cyclobacteriaceae bacterium]
MGIYPVRFLFVLFMLASGPSLAGAPSGLSDLPLREFPSMGGEKILLVYFTGDGGWNNFSQQLVRQINANHCPVVAFDCRKYFWEAKDPVKFAEDVQRLISHYL